MENDQKRERREWVEALANAACIALSTEEIEDLGEELSRLMDALAFLDETNGEDETAWLETAVSLDELRTDQPTPSLCQADAIASAERREDGFFAVPRAVENGGGV